MGASVSARQAAKVCGVSEKTVRNWIASGRLSATRSSAGFRIDRDQLPQQERISADSEDVRTLSADQSAAMLELVRLVDRLQQENRELAADNARLRALPPAPAERPISGDSEHVVDETTQRSSDARNGRSWWQFWRASPA
jgi:excisionase family DNA binding protein